MYKSIPSDNIRPDVETRIRIIPFEFVWVSNDQDSFIEACENRDLKIG